MTYPIQPEGGAEPESTANGYPGDSSHAEDHTSNGHSTYGSYGSSDGSAEQESGGAAQTDYTSYFNSSSWPDTGYGSSDHSAGSTSHPPADTPHSYTFDSPYPSGGYDSQHIDSAADTDSYRLSDPPPPPAPVRDPHPELSSEWTYRPAEQPLADRPTPAQWGWRRRVRTATGGLVSLPPGHDEQDHREALSVIRSTLPGSRTIVVANEKGGAGKTPTALILSALLAEQRREPVVAWDVNELRGTLGRRAEVTDPSTTVSEMLAAAPELARPEVEIGAVARYLRRQPEGNLVLASSEDGNAMRQIGHAECDVIRQLLLRRYGLVVCDTGNNAAASNFLYTVDSGDVLVVPTSPSSIHLEVARAMLRMLASRETTAHLVARAVLVVTSGTGKRLTADEEDWFARRVGRVVHVPADPVIAEGGKLPISALTKASRRAWTEVAAAVVEAALKPSPHDDGAGQVEAAADEEIAPYAFDDDTPKSDSSSGWRYDYGDSGDAGDSDLAGSSSVYDSGSSWHSSAGSGDGYFS